ncbi:MAG TPA: hypothetical protein VFH73_20675 [Polyangia bacterium]|nr:hypothetical protein [Polyangia bacterium]
MALGLGCLLGLASCMTDQRVATLGLEPISDGGEVGSGGGAGGEGIGVDAGEAGHIEAGVQEHFNRIGPGQPLPTESSCALRVKRSVWEPRVDNSPFNQRVPTASQLTPLATGMAKTGIGNELGKRVTGNFVGTTDEILQWASCKWGFDEDFVRAFAVQSSNWRQDEWRSWSGNAMDCPANAETRNAFGATECAAIYGILQISWHYHKTTWPMIHDSTAFNVDYALGYVRTCFEKQSTWLDNSPIGKAYVAGDEWGCVGAFYSGNWYDKDGSLYMKGVRDKLAAKTWTRFDF